MVLERRWLSALHVLEPAQVAGGKLTERDATAQPLVGVMFEQGLVKVVLAHELEHSRCGLGLRERAVACSSATQYRHLATRKPQEIRELDSLQRSTEPKVGSSNLSGA